ncbi:MAG: hypothetical protein CSB55_01720 [Candidatus Cloacimonadota bacterium]|nr:MAG: hypothetical protein CSB55_01720 [Candidatus Cloacimonadota bacterium]
MQVKKEKVTQAITDNAYLEFLEKGYQGTSMRSIAKRSGISLANIYNYFSSKDDLFCEILRPLTDNILGYIEYIRPENYLEDHLESLEEHMVIAEKMAEYIDREREKLNLLLFKAAGSSLERFRDKVIDLYTEISLSYSKIISLKETGKEFIVSEFVAHNIAGTWANFIVESLMHNLSKEDIAKSGKEMMLFMYNGWTALMREKD